MSAPFQVLPPSAETSTEVIVASPSLKATPVISTSPAPGLSLGNGEKINLSIL